MPLEQPRPSNGRTPPAVRVIAAVVAALAGSVFLTMTWIVLSSRFGGDDRDVHGYGMLFGVPVAVVAGLVVAVSLPWAVAPARRARTTAVSLGGVAVVAVLLVVAVATA